MRFSISADSRVGCVRENNEDMILVNHEFLRDGSMHTHVDIDLEERYLVALADGMGGHNSGEVASSDVLHNLEFFFSDIPSTLTPGDFNESIYEWLTSMNNIIESKGAVDPQLRNMGTTLVCLAYYGGDFYWLNCGDSRLYLLHEGKLSQITTDHSYNNMMGITQHSNIITNCVGGGCTTSYIDIVQFTAQVTPGDTIMLCSDGLSDMIDDATIERILNEGGNATVLCKAAEQAGGNDNVSTIVIRID